MTWANSVIVFFLAVAAVSGGCAHKQFDVVPPGWKANSERTAVIGRLRDSTVIITRHGYTRDYRDVLDSLNLGPATVEQYDLYWVTPLKQ